MHTFHTHFTYLTFSFLVSCDSVPGSCFTSGFLCSCFKITYRVHNITNMIASRCWIFIHTYWACDILGWVVVDSSLVDVWVPVSWFESLFRSWSWVDDDGLMTWGWWCRICDFDLKVSGWWHQDESFDLMVFVLIVSSRWFWAYSLEKMVSNWKCHADCVWVGRVEIVILSFGIELKISSWKYIICDLWVGGIELMILNVWYRVEGIELMIWEYRFNVLTWWYRISDLSSREMFICSIVFGELDELIHLRFLLSGRRLVLRIGTERPT